MAFQITVTREYKAQMSMLRARERRIVENAVLSHLQDQPTAQTNAVKRLRPNSFAEYQLQAGELRVLYNVEGDEVVLLAVGRKAGNTLIVEGDEFHEHQDDSPEPPGNGPAGDPG
jgi:mRNA-degrading endonuclease RelE of RelBE toxin-antitoxin system